MVGVTGAFIGLVFARTYINNAAVPVVSTLVAPGNAERVLILTTQPDDEIPIGGTIRSMADQGAEITLAVLTQGESPRVKPDGASKEQIAAVRTAELQAAAQTLGIAHVEQFTLPDGSLAKTDSSALVAIISDLVDTYQPSTVITFDSTIGLYNGADQKALGQVSLGALEGLAVDPAFPVRQLWVPTLPEHTIDLVKEASASFRKNYPTSGPGLPPPTVAVDVGITAQAKAEAARQHVSQQPELEKILPGYTMIPDRLFFQLFDLEYFHLAWENDTAL